jgi:C-terminal processing protease CtpA/Prc
MLAIDVTGNGGGSEWSEEAAALFTAGTVTRPSPRRLVDSCDRSAIWLGAAVCSNLAPAGAEDRLQGKGAWRGPLVVLVDKRTASAAEDFAYWLAGSGVARLVGQRTFGAGCGYVDGGWAYQFTAFDAHAMMPNCSRYTREGINQIEGLEPDVSYDWSAGPGGLSAVLEAAS